jgi:oligosaccharyltransferase complex subunit alpha (ribophorin I)
VLYAVRLPTPLAPRQTASLSVTEVYLHTLHPLPAEVREADPQRMLFVGNGYLWSPYTTKTQSTLVA